MDHYVEMKDGSRAPLNGSAATDADPKAAGATPQGKNLCPGR